MTSRLTYLCSLSAQVWCVLCSFADKDTECGLWRKGVRGWHIIPAHTKNKNATVGHQTQQVAHSCCSSFHITFSILYRHVECQVGGLLCVLPLERKRTILQGCWYPYTTHSLKHRVKYKPRCPKVLPATGNVLK